MRNHANILVLLAVFIYLSERTYASIGVTSFVNKGDTAKCVVLKFAENHSQLDEHFADNGMVLATLDSLLKQLPDQAPLFEWQIKSYSCPKGITGYNRELALLRGKSVMEFLRKRYLGIDTSKMTVLAEGEDWAEFRRLIAADPNVPDGEEVLMLIDYHKTDVDKRRELIQRLDRGIPYRYIVQEVLPKLRRAEITVSWNNPEVVSTTSEVSVRVPSDSCLVNSLIQATDKEIEKSLPATTSIGKEKSESSRTVLAIKNNILYDLALAPNLEIEIPIGKKWSFNTEYKCPWWINNRRSFCYQLLSGGVEARYWLGNRQKRNRLTGHFLGLYAEGGIYDFQFNDERGYQGKYYGASGMTYGYALQLARHFSMEFSLGVGYLTTEYKKYVPYEEDIVKTTSGRYNFIGPTKLKVSLVWLLTKGR